MRACSPKHSAATACAAPSCHRRDVRIACARLPTLLRLATSRSALTRTMATTSVDTLIFDVDDTLYPVSSGFSKHRNGPIVARFMVDELGFETEAEALALRDEVFSGHTLDAQGADPLASQEGRLPEALRAAHARRVLGGANCEFDAYFVCRAIMNFANSSVN